MLVNALKRFVILFLVCFVANVQAQVSYSTKADYVKLRTEGEGIFSSWKISYPDSTLTELSNSFTRNFMGNIGLPSPRYILDYGTSGLGFRFFDPPTDQDRFKEKDVTYYRTSGPYASLTGIAGSKQLQAFKLLFTHTYKEKLNITLRLNRYSSLGFYKRQQTYINNFFLSSNYSNNKWGYDLFILNNNNRNQESGGLRDSVLTDSTSSISKELLPVRLTGAQRDNRETKAMIHPWFRLNRRPDSIPSTDHYLHLKSDLAFNMYRYRDANSVADQFYQYSALDSAATTDSTHVRQFSNELSYALISQGSKFSFSAGYKNEINAVWQEGDSLIFNHLAISSLMFKNHLKGKDTLVKNRNSIESGVSAQYVIAGGNEGNFKIENRNVLTFNQTKKRNLFLKLLYEKRSPDYIYNNWLSNHFQWMNNGYDDQQLFQLTAGVELGKVFRAAVFCQTASNFLYFDRSALPRQLTGTVYNSGVNLEFGKIIFKHLGVAVSYTLQNTSAPKYQRLPENSATAKLFYNAIFFRNNLQLQIGSQVQMYQSFTPYAYMPATQVFYLQDKFETASYPFLDVYLNARIRPVSFFLKLENVLNGRVGNNYAMVAGYYQSDLAFRFGLTWIFFD